MERYYGNERLVRPVGVSLPLTQDLPLVAIDENSDWEILSGLLQLSNASRVTVRPLPAKSASMLLLMFLKYDMWDALNKVSPDICQVFGIVFVGMMHIVRKYEAEFEREQNEERKIKMREEIYRFVCDCIRPFLIKYLNIDWWHKFAALFFHGNESIPDWYGERDIIRATRFRVLFD